MRISSILLVVAVGCVVGCVKRPTHQSLLVCGGTLSAEDVVQRTLAATTTEYSWARSWLEEHCATSSVPVSQRIFILRDSRPRAASIVEHRVGLTLGDILRQVGVAIADARVLPQIGPARDQRIDTADRTYDIQPLDLVSIGGTHR